jgi:hypothetical protein
MVLHLDVNNVMICLLNYTVSRNSGYETNSNTGRSADGAITKRRLAESLLRVERWLITRVDCARILGMVTLRHRS